MCAEELILYILPKVTDYFIYNYVYLGTYVYRIISYLQEAIYIHTQHQYFYLITIMIFFLIYTQCVWQISLGGRFNCEVAAEGNACCWDCD